MRRSVVGATHPCVLDAYLVGVELLDGAHPALRRNQIRANLREGLKVGDGAVAEITDCTLRANGSSRVVKGGRRGERLHGDDSGAGVVVLTGGEARMQGNQIMMNLVTEGLKLTHAFDDE